MKTSIFLLLIYLPLSCLPQHWADKNAVWHYSQTMFAPPFTHPFKKFTAVGDTIINGDKTKILKEENISIIDTSYSKIYMKSDSNRVYLFVPELNSFQLIYDFNALPGDSIRVFCRDLIENLTITIVVDSLSKMQVNGNNLKVQHVHQVYSSEDKYAMNGKIIENIGWTGFMFPLHSWADPPYGGPLRCFQNDNIFLKLSGVDCDFTGYFKSDLVVQNKTWVFLIAGDYPNPEIYTDWRYKIGNDTVVEGVSFKNLLFAQGNDQYDRIRGFIREEENGKVYFKTNSGSNENEFLLYDFGMEVGDTAHMGLSGSFHRLDSVKRNIDGKKVYYLTESQFGNDVWIEGVGSTHGLLKEQITGGAMMFSCCLLDDAPLCHSPGFESCYFNGNNNLWVDAGNDTTFCGGFGQSDSILLGSNLTIKNGTPPFSYQWKSRLQISENLIFTASDFLNDTAADNPLITNGTTLGLPLKFFVQVTDAENNTALDSITINFSNCACPTGYTVIQINKGDSVFLDAGKTYGKYNKFYWIPDYGLSNPDSSATWCKPSSTMQYSVVSVDTFGCECACTTYEIRVYDPVSFFIHPDASWSVVNTFGNGNPQNPDFVEINTTLYGYQGDTIIGNKNWLKMYASNDPDFKSGLQFSGYINNDDDKILFTDKTGKTDTLYDFSLEAGDSVKYEFPFGIEYLKIEHIDSVEFAGRLLKRFSFEEPSWHPGFLNEMWLENIGSIHGPLFPAHPGIFSDEIPDSTVLSCFKLSYYLVWLNANFGECYVSTSVLNEKLTDDVKIFPNPANHEINIYLPPELQPSKIELINLNGNTLLQFPAQNTNTYKLEVAGIPSGFYFLHIVSNRHQFVRKISIQK